MVRLIMGVKGSGKTKHLIELINNAVAFSFLSSHFILRFSRLP